jgi:type IV pilus assembly protein PilE
MNKKEKGFTLIELMIVVAIIGVIGAIAVPSYNSYMLKSRRSDAKVGMAKVADRQERYYLQNNTYTTSLADLGLTGDLTENSYYQLSVTSADVAAFELEADANGTGASGQGGDTTTSAGDCTVMVLDSLGVKTPADCW